jgi:hypothetical protein
VRGLGPAEVARFYAGREAFERVKTAADGLGPVFNADSCAACHTQGAVGGASDIVVIRVGRRADDGTFNPLTQLGGTLIQTSALGETAPGCFFPRNRCRPRQTSWRTA